MQTSKIICHICGKGFSKYGIKNHIAVTHEGKTERVAHFVKGNRKGWNKGLTKETNEIVRKIAIATGNAQRGKLGHPQSIESKMKLSVAMKRAHKDGRAWNIGKSRWKNEPSWPEKFFIKVIEENNIDKNYIREYNVGRYSIDFAWPEKKLAVEIDGEQHKRFEVYLERDKRKDQFLIENGWKILRIEWKMTFNNPKEQIQKLIEFVN